MAEYFRDVKNQDVLLFIDNIFRFTQAGSEVSALLGRMPSAVGYQPTLATEMGALQERITSTRKGSKMCIRDNNRRLSGIVKRSAWFPSSLTRWDIRPSGQHFCCLLYTSRTLQRQIQRYG